MYCCVVIYSGDQATANLRWLTSQQALADFAYFQTVYQSQLNTNYTKTTNNKWFTLGGSYPGALSSWYRQKYPHLTVGSLASSGVVDAYLSMPGKNTSLLHVRIAITSAHVFVHVIEFDQQVQISAGPACADALRATTADIEAKLSCKSYDTHHHLTLTCVCDQ